MSVLSAAHPEILEWITALQGNPSSEISSLDQTGWKLVQDSEMFQEFSGRVRSNRGLRFQSCPSWGTLPGYHYECYGFRVPKNPTPLKRMLYSLTLFSKILLISSRI